MDNVISEYQKWKQQGESLRVQAKQAMEGRFRDLLLEAAQIAQEYHRDFGASLKPPATITAFRFKAGANAKAKAASGKPAVKKAPAAAAAPASAPNQKVTGLLKQKAGIQKKLEAARAAGKPTRNLDDRLYEIDDELRLAGGGA
ncbi:MAG TPA: hypothetical protein VG273_14300 [Bryobacteraceae bacterium]|jgi:hypothetical protein|nr:hypothetical protein [Bryobacteraceae bacterium]